MRSALSGFFQWLRQRAVLHPSAAMLMASSLEGGLEPAEDARIKAHLSCCAACRQRLEELQAGLRMLDHGLVRRPPDFFVEQGLGRLHTAIQAWNEQQADGRQAVLSTAFWERLTMELSIYMGRQTAKALLQTCNRPGVQADDLNAVIEPVVTGFFGRQTGSAVAANVVRLWRHAQAAAAQPRSAL